jgi:hypothetical protein
MRPVQDFLPLTSPTTQRTPMPERDGLAANRPESLSFSSALSRAAASAPLEHTPPPSTAVRVRAGDTLTSLVRQQMDKVGLALSGRDLSALVKQVAAANGLKDPDRIFVGDRLDLSKVVARPESARSDTARAESDGTSPRLTRTVLRPVAEPTASRSAHGLLDRTLQRAVDKGFLDPENLATARARVLELAKTYGFQPDDFARVVLLESDGFNPRATNGRCHGIIQFCEGPNHGAASVGLAGQARSILDKDVLTQLDLVDRYFQDTGLEQFGAKAGRRIDLADLYLTILTPAARSERDARTPLSIAGAQAAVLHEAGDRSRPITRQSIVQGLHRYAQQLFAEGPRKPVQPLAEGGKPTGTARQTLAAGMAYQTVSMLPAADDGRTRSGL